MRLSAILTVASCLMAASAGVQAANTKITESDFGEEWPFTVGEGVLHCSDNEVTFRANGLEYAVNGSATAAGYAPIEPIWRYNIELLEEIAEALEMTVDEVKESSPMRVSIGPIIKAGLALCDG